MFQAMTLYNADAAVTDASASDGSSRSGYTVAERSNNVAYPVPLVLADPRYTGPVVQGMGLPEQPAPPALGPAIVDPRYTPQPGSPAYTLKQIVDNAKATAAAAITRAQATAGIDGAVTTPSSVFVPPTTWKPPALANDIRGSIPVTVPAFVAPVVNTDRPGMLTNAQGDALQKQWAADAAAGGSYNDIAARQAASAVAANNAAGITSGSRYGVPDTGFTGPAKVLPGTVQDPRYATPANPLGVRVTTPTAGVVASAPWTTAATAPAASGGALNVNRVPSAADTSSPAGGGGATPYTPYTLPTNVTTAAAPINWLPIILAALVALFLLRGRS